jgi:hypothetical protein
MAAAHREAHAGEPVSPVPAPAIAAPGFGGLPAQVLALQRSAGNQAVARAIAQGRLQRDDTASVGITGVALNHGKVSSPPESSLGLRATPVPAKASGVTWSVGAGTAAVSGTTIAADGSVTVGGSQPGGTVKVKGTSDDGSWADMELRVVEKPTTLASTTAADASTAAQYAGAFFHSFTGASGSGSGVEGANVNEKFDSLSAATPFGPFTLTANVAGSHGWDLDASGQMAGKDTVSIDKSTVDANAFVPSASNPSPGKPLPQGFSMTQHLHTKSFPSGAADAAAFTDTAHVRTLEESAGSLVMTLKAGKDSVSVDYAGPPVFRKAAASPAKVEASAAKPVAEKGKKAPEWVRNEVQVSVESTPATATPTYSIQGAALGCDINASTGLVRIGTTAGKITVRAGDAKHYDEVEIEITAPPAPAPAKPAAASGEAEEAEGPSADAGPPDLR